MYTIFDANLHLKLEILRQTELKPYTEKIVATALSREDFIEFSKKFVKASRERKNNWDKMIIIGNFKGFSFNMIKLIKYEIQS